MREFRIQLKILIQLKYYQARCRIQVITLKSSEQKRAI